MPTVRTPSAPDSPDGQWPASRAFDRNLGEQGCPAADVTRDLQRAAERLDTVYQTDKPRPLVDFRTTDAVVPNQKTQVGTVGVDAHIHVYDRGSCVFGRVSERFSDDVIGGHFGGVRQLWDETEVEFDGHSRAAGKCFERGA
jgi:hypothetical protein